MVAIALEATTSDARKGLLRSAPGHWETLGTAQIDLSQLVDPAGGQRSLAVPLAWAEWSPAESRTAKITSRPRGWKPAAGAGAVGFAAGGEEPEQPGTPTTVASEASPFLEEATVAGARLRRTPRAAPPAARRAARHALRRPPRARRPPPAVRCATRRALRHPPPRTVPSHAHAQLIGR